MNYEDSERELNWDDTIKKDNQFILYPEGDYDFTVESFDRGRHPGSKGIPPCNKAILKIRINVSGKEVIITHNLFLHSTQEWKLSEFFTSIGQKKKGETLRMNWSTVPGSTGRLKLGTRVYDGNTYNDIKKFYPKENATPGFTPGKF